ncbi:hypothetical protein SAMN05444144_1251, partial [Flavobacterium akiainvivens]
MKKLYLSAFIALVGFVDAFAQQDPH